MHSYPAQWKIRGASGLRISECGIRLERSVCRKAYPIEPRKYAHGCAPIANAMLTCVPELRQGENGRWPSK